MSGAMGARETGDTATWVAKAHWPGSFSEPHLEIKNDATLLNTKNRPELRGSDTRGIRRIRDAADRPVQAAHEIDGEGR